MTTNATNHQRGHGGRLRQSWRSDERQGLSAPLAFVAVSSSGRRRSSATRCVRYYFTQSWSTYM